MACNFRFCDVRDVSFTGYLRIRDARDKRRRHSRSYDSRNSGVLTKPSRLSILFLSHLFDFSSSRELVLVSDSQGNTYDF